MPNLIRTGAAWLAGKLKGSAGVEVVYSQRGGLPLSLTATATNQADEVANDEGFAVLVRYRELIVTTADLGSVIPRPGDVWQEGGDGYQVCEAGMKPHFERMDEQGIMSVVRGKKVS
jgi:hypothetical protein